MLSEPPLGILLAGYGILGLAIFAAAAGPELAAGVEIAPFIPELAPIFSGLRLVMP